ncbi:RebB family R body protein [Shewanella waksmanii]|uniref:RebB family R body protein n=1 Tax=Shewanella waksmanii TaxID=213783 RepID=UPI003735A1CF
MANSNSAIVEGNINQALPFSVAVSAVTMASSIGLLMENAVFNEKNSQAIQNASVSQCCVFILGAGAAKAAKG